MDEAARENELERLRRENEALNEHIKLLVRTEQRLLRSQNELDAQLTRIRSLARFALDSSSSEAPSVVLERALGMLTSNLLLEWAGIVRVNATTREATLACAYPGAPEAVPVAALEPEVFEWADSLTQPALVALPRGAREGAPLRLLRRWWPAVAALPDPAYDGILACLPLRCGGAELRGLVLAYAIDRKRLYWRNDSLTDRQLPFLQLLANHLDRALENTTLTESLRERGAQLAASLEALEKTQQELLQSQKMEAIGRLAGGVAHDFNNLLTVILGYAESLRTGLPPDAPQQRPVRQILESGQRAASITGQLLAFSRRQIRRPENLDLGELTGRTMELLRRLVGEHIALELELDPSLGCVLADRAQIEQVLLNLVVNARDAVPEGGTMKIRTRPALPADAARCQSAVDPATLAVLEVEDDGVGMDETTRARVFEPFFTTKAPGQGTGLGLAVVYGIVMQNEGHILVESAPSAGSRFTVLLPRASGEARASAVPSEDRSRHGPATILVVEDEPRIREIMARLLRDAGHRVTEAGDGEAALEAFGGADAPLDLLVTDVVMPRMGGVKLAAVLRRTRPRLRVLYVSGYSEDLRLVRSADHAADWFLAKPFTPKQLLAQVAAALQGVASGPEAPADTRG